MSTNRDQTAEDAAAGPGRTPGDRWREPSQVVALIAALAAFALGASFLGSWLLSGFAASEPWTEWLGYRMKTNTSVALTSLAGAVIGLTFGGSRGLAVARVLAIAAGVIAALTLTEYLAGVELGIDELLARDHPARETLNHPNRMAPNAAVALICMSAALLLLPNRRPGRALAGHALAILTLAICLLALVGYLYDAEVLYQPTQYIRISPYTATGVGLVAIGALFWRKDVGLSRLLISAGPGGYLSRRLAVLALLAPIAFGWLRLAGERRDLYGTNTGTSLLVLLTMATFVLVVVVLARSLERVDAQRREAEADLQRSAALTAALARAATVGEVVEVTLRLGLPALRAASGGILLLSEDGQRLTIADAQGYPQTLVNAYRSFAVDADLPASAAVRTHRSVFVASRAEYQRRFPSMPAETIARHEAFAALPLHGRARIIGVLALSFSEAQSFPDERQAGLLQLAWQCGQALDRALLFDSEKLARESAEAANRSKDEFLAMLGHELRNPLSPILTGLHVMSLRPDRVHEKERAIIERQVNHMVRLVDDLLDVSRITRGKVELERRRIDVAALIAKAIEIASPLYEQRRHQLTTAVAPGLTLVGDDHRLTQVFANLLTNAAKYTPAGGQIHVAAEVAPTAIVVKVKDTGIGIAADLLPRVFDLFVQGERTPERSAGGLGLGLAITRRLVELHGGRVEAASDGPDRGSEFTVMLPLTGADELAAEAPVGPAAPRRRATDARRVLVVDDNRDAAEILAEALTIEGHDTRVAYDGPAALALLASYTPEVAFLDIGLPVMDGYELARRLRAQQHGPLTLVALTGYGQPGDRARSEAAGFDEHMVKPIALGRALEIVERRSAPPPIARGAQGPASLADEG